MRFFGVLSILAAATLALAEDKTPPTELVIDRTFTPEDCSITAAAGDKIEVHYVCCIHVFERWVMAQLLV